MLAPTSDGNDVIHRIAASLFAVDAEAIESLENGVPLLG